MMLKGHRKMCWWIYLVLRFLQQKKDFWGMIRFTHQESNSKSIINIKHCETVKTLYYYQSCSLRTASESTMKILNKVS